MRKLFVPLAGLMLLAILAAASVAQAPVTTVTVSPKVTPNKAGTKKDPQGVKLDGTIRWETESGVEPPIVTAFDILLTKHGRFNGGKYPKCSQAVANRNGPSGCPKKSIMGTARVTALADDVVTHAKTTFINGGARNICFYTVLTNPARVQTCVPGKLTKINHPKWGYRLKITVPEVLQVVAGVPIAVREVKWESGGRPWAKDWIVTTGCPKGNKWPYEFTTSYLYEDGSRSSSTYKGSVACRK